MFKEQKMKELRSFLDLVKEVKEIYDIDGYGAHKFIERFVDENSEEKEKDCKCNLIINKYSE